MAFDEHNELLILTASVPHFLNSNPCVIFSCDVKGLVHPKMKILSVFTHPHVVLNPYVFICSAEHKFIWKNVLIKQISFPID